MKNKLISIMLIGILVFSVTSCKDKKENDKDNKTQTENTSNNKDVGDELKGKNNSEKLMNFLFDLMEKYNSEAPPHLIGYLKVEYKDNLENPENGNTDIYAIDNRWGSIFADSDIEITQSAHVIADADSIRFDNPKKGTQKSTYGCNKGNVGVTIAVFLFEHIYIYEIDKNGKKKNELTKKYIDMGD